MCLIFDLKFYFTDAGKNLLVTCTASSPVAWVITAELIASQTADHINFTQNAGNSSPSRWSRQSPAPWPLVSLMYLELIHIQKQQCSTMSIALGCRDRLLELMLKAASVVKAGQWIMIRQASRNSAFF